MAENKYRNYKAKGYGDQSFNSGRKDPWYKNLDPVYLSSLCKDENHIIRFATEPIPFGQHTVYTDPSDMGKDYTERRGKAFFVWCPEFDPDTKQFDYTGKGCCDICNKFAKKGLLGRGRIAYFAQGYELEVKRNGRKAWSELRTYVFNSMLCESIQNVMETVGNGVEPSNKKNGYELHITYKSTSPATWFVQKGDEIQLQEIDTYNPEDFADIISMFEPTDPEDIKSDLDRLGYYEFIEGGSSRPQRRSRNDFDDEDDDERRDSHRGRQGRDDDEPSEGRSRPSRREREEDDEPSGGRARNSRASREEEDETDERPSRRSRNDFDEDEDERRDTRSNRREREDEPDEEKSSKPSKKRSFDDDDDPDEEKPSKPSKKRSFDEDEDEVPRKGTASADNDDKPSEDVAEDKPAPKSDKKHSFDDDDDPAEDEVEQRESKPKVVGTRKQLWEMDD